MIFEHRTYEVAPGRIDELNQRFKDHTLRLFSKHGIRPVLFGVPIFGESSDKFLYIVSFDDFAHMERAWKNFMVDEERKAIWAKSNEDGPLVMKIHSSVYRAISYDN